MRTTIQFALSLCLAVITASAACAQTDSTEAPRRAELALNYTYIHSNAPPGGCGCFNLNGGSATFAWPLGRDNWQVVGDVSVATTSSITSAAEGLTLSAYTVGARYRLRLHTPALHPYGQALVGLAHSSGSLVQGQNQGASNAGAAFAANLGGGLDLRASSRFSVRLFEADYLVTTFDNGTNNHQNNFRISAGLVIHF
jgi:outer membrane immunogenic protein